MKGILRFAQDDQHHTLPLSRGFLLLKTKGRGAPGLFVLPMLLCTTS